MPRFSAKTLRRLRRIALGFAVGVLWSHATILVVFWTADLKAPWRLTAMERAWVYQHQRIAQVLVVGLLVSAVLTLLAALLRGRHRLLLVGSWTAFTFIAAIGHYREMAAMLRVSWWWLT